MPDSNKKPPFEKYNAFFATSLRDFMECHPDTGEKTTQKSLADFLGVRPQTVSYYCTGESLPNCEQLLKMAEFFNVTCDFLMTGRRTENKPVRELLGLSEDTIQKVKLLNEGYFDNSPLMLSILDVMLGDRDFYSALENAAEYEGKKKEGLADDYLQFLEWKAAGTLHKYLLHFFAYNLASMHDNLKNKDEKGNDD